MFEPETHIWQLTPILPARAQASQHKLNLGTCRVCHSDGSKCKYLIIHLQLFNCVVGSMWQLLAHCTLDNHLTPPSFPTIYCRSVLLPRNSSPLCHILKLLASTDALDDLRLNSTNIIVAHPGVSRTPKCPEITRNNRIRDSHECMGGRII
jgi:hypothetical protein